MSRLASLTRAQAAQAAGEKTAGVLPAKNPVAEIRQGLLATISFNDDGSFDVNARERVAAVSELLNELDGALEIRAISDSGIKNMDVAIARARRVYLELIARNEALAERDVAITISANPETTLLVNKPIVEIFWRGAQ